MSRWSPPVWDFRGYGVFGFLAGMRNYSAVPEIAAPRGFPDDAGPTADAAYEDQCGDAHTASWLGFEELAGFDYGAAMVDRRVERTSGNRTDGDVTGTAGEGRPTTFRDFLGGGYFDDLERVRAAGVGRVVFWFDN